MPLTDVLNVIRVKFTRGQEVKFISHLDLMKVFERALRRSHLPVAYSSGFNPHPGMVFGLPLSVGVTSSAEYADFELAQKLPPREFMERLNEQLPKGLEITAACRRAQRENIMASIVRAKYDIAVIPEGDTTSAVPDEHAVPGGFAAVMSQGVKELLDKPVIMMQKYTKSGMKDVDIRPMIYGLQVGQAAPGAAVIHALLSAGSALNLKPELLITALKDGSGLGFKIAGINRVGLYIEKNGMILDPIAACAESL